MDEQTRLQRMGYALQDCWSWLLSDHFGAFLILAYVGTMGTTWGLFALFQHIVCRGEC